MRETAGAKLSHSELSGADIASSAFAPGHEER